MAISNPPMLDKTLAEVATKTEEISSKLVTPQTDWDESDQTKMSYIAHKPEIYDPNDQTKPSITDLADEAAALFANIATVETSTTASRAYAAKEYLILNDLFYRVTVSISQGGTITPGTNVIQTTIGSELKALNV